MSAAGYNDAPLWVSLYFAANLVLTLHNKWVLSHLHFNFPWTLTALHIAVSGVGTYFIQKAFYNGKHTDLDRGAHLKLLQFSALYAVNIAISNVSLAYVSLAFHQLFRSSTPAFTVVMEFFLFKRIHSWRIYISLIPVVFGICLATVAEFSDISFTPIGLFLTIFGVLLSCLKGIVTNVLMVGPLKLPPLEVIWRMALPSALQCMLYAAIFGELRGLPDFFTSTDLDNGGVEFNYSATLKLSINAFMAMCLNWVSFTANKKTSALTMTVAGNIKQALSIVLAIYIFDTNVSLTNLFGVIIALLGGGWYRYINLIYVISFRLVMNLIYSSKKFKVTNQLENTSWCKAAENNKVFIGNES